MPISNHFQRIDLNSDGAIEKEEAKKAMRSKKQKMKKHRKKGDRKKSFNKN
jgi:Ca2+-binding EF-hand superfamily protein